MSSFVKAGAHKARSGFDKGRDLPRMSYGFCNMYEEYKKVRNRIRKHDPMDVVMGCIEHLNSTNTSDIDYMAKYPPWQLLLLLNWALLETGNLVHGYKALPVNSFNYLVNLVKDFDNKQKLPNECENLLLFMRRLFFQQFWLQRDFNKIDFSRQVHFFSGFVHSSSFNDIFCSETGLDISLFPELSLGLASHFVGKENSFFIQESFFQSLYNSISAKTCDSFISSMSLDLPGVRGYLEKTKKFDSLVFNNLEQTPLMRYPLLKNGNRYYCYSRQLLWYSLQNNIYQIIKNSNHSSRNKWIGDTMQMYIEAAIKCVKSTFFNEKKLRKYTGNKKVVDFLVSDSGNNVFIESKAVEMAALAKVSADRQIVRDKTKKTILYAIEQGMATAQALSNSDVSSSDYNSQGINFLLIVTYDDLYIGNGRDYYEYIAKENVDKLLDHLGMTDKPVIPIENIYIISLREFDLLVGTISNSEYSFSDILDIAISNDSDPNTKTFQFSQHFPQLEGGFKAPDYLEKTFNGVVSQLEARLTG